MTDGVLLRESLIDRELDKSGPSSRHPNFRLGRAQGGGSSVQGSFDANTAFHVYLV